MGVTYLRLLYLVQDGALTNLYIIFLIFSLVLLQSFGYGDITRNQ